MSVKLGLLIILIQKKNTMLELLVIIENKLIDMFSTSNTI